MRHVFILNPAAGKNDSTCKLAAEIQHICKQRGLNYEIRCTQMAGHATELVKEELESTPDEICRIYACGGDGTLNEVVAGAALYPNAEVACFPCGTGNDFVKNFDGLPHFQSFEDLIDGEATDIDLMEIGGRHAINICTTGLDARVADWASKNKRKCVFSGSFPYKVSVLVNIFGKIPRTYKIIADGVDLSGEYTIMVIASGRHYGGSYHAVPDAQPDDGWLHLLFVKKVSRPVIASLIGKYEAGKYKELGDYVLRTRAKSVTFIGETEEPINLDGEIIPMRDFTVRLAERKLRFVVPKGASLIYTAYENPSDPLREYAVSD